MPFLDGNPVIITKRNVDDMGDPISVKQIETKQVVDIHNSIPLNYSIDRNHPIVINGLYQIYNKDEITENTFWADYDQGILYFHSRLVGKSLTITYMGTGYILISSDRIYRYNKGDGTSATESIEASFEKLENILNTIIQGGNIAGNIEIEVIGSRTDAQGQTFPSLGDRLNYITAQLDTLTKIVRYKRLLKVNAAITTVPVGIAEYNPKSDTLSVYLSGVRMIEGEDYSLDEASRTITCLKGQWNIDDELYFEVLQRSTDNTPPGGGGSLPTSIDASNVILNNPMFGADNAQDAFVQIDILLKDKVDKADFDDLKNKVDRVCGLSDNNVGIYVNANTGNDDTGEGTQAKPYKTIQKAFDTIPKIISKSHTVYLAEGTYDEEPYLSGVIGAAIYVRSYGVQNIDPSVSVPCKVRALRFYDIMGYVHIEDVAPIDNNITSRAFILFSRCIYASVSRCRFDVNFINSNKRSIEWDGTNGSVGTSYFANQFICVYSLNGSSVRIDENCVIQGLCNRALYAENGFIFKNGDVQWHFNNANYPETEVDGGHIWGRPVYEWRNATYENGWNTSGNIPLRFRREGELIILTGWITKNQLDTTVITTLPTGYRPINAQRYKIPIGGTSAVQVAEPTLDIAINGEVKLLNTGNVTTNIIVINVIFPRA